MDMNRNMNIIQRYCHPLLITLGFMMAPATPLLAECEEHADESLIAYVPTLLTAPASLIASGIGYTIDGIFYVGAPIATASLLCIPVIALSASSNNGPVFTHCLSDLSRHVSYSNTTPIDTDVGPTIYRATRDWRCPYQ